jgi:hypothetical protein
MLTFLARFLRRVIINVAPIRPGWAAPTATDLRGPAVDFPPHLDLSSIHIMVVAQVQPLVRAEFAARRGGFLALLRGSGHNKCHDGEGKESELHIEIKTVFVWIDDWMIDAIVLIYSLLHTISPSRFALSP